MNYINTSSGERISRAVFDRRINEAKKAKLDQFFDEHRYFYCEEKDCGANDRDLLAANNIKLFAFSKNNTAGIVGFQACGDEGVPLSVKQEAQSIGYAVGGQFT